MPLIQTPVAEIEYLENGDPGGRPVVLLHGFPDIPATWDEVISVLPRGLRIVRPYLRGYGGSRVRPASWKEAGGAQVAALATDVLDLLDVLGLGQVLLVGHDWGARAAYAVAVLAPERVTGLVTMATAYGPMRHLNAAERFTEAERAWYRYWLCTDTGAQTFALHPAAFIRRCWAEWSPAFYLPEDQTQAIIRAAGNEQFTEAVVHHYRHGTGAAPGCPRYAEAQARLDEWPRIDAPASFLYGVDDGCEIAAAGRGNADMFTQAYGRSELPGAGHFLPRERPGAVAAAIKQRLQQAAGLPVDRALLALPDAGSAVEAIDMLSGRQPGCDDPHDPVLVARTAAAPWPGTAQHGADGRSGADAPRAACPAAFNDQPGRRKRPGLDLCAFAVYEPRKRGRPRH